eukprot:TRINITY_DN15043_c0_g1_i1.p1 TRINITY_DN15043_c0_g1~~TRINITY_DN15043_c0_g1_i1.p1  ORF type:complete len:381 (-),score=114.81 TRINITY_DN15043_c0_g1_i1:1150-2244(-)
MAHLNVSDEVPTPEMNEVAARSKQDRIKAFEDVYKKLAADVIADLPQFEMPADAIAYVAKLLDYTVPGGKMNRGLSVIDTLEILLRRELTDDEFFKASVLGWTIEWLQAFFLVADDLMDSSHTRRGEPCWFRLPEVGLIAANDSLILESCIWRIFRTYFGNERYYVDLVHLMQDVSFKTQLGQMLDLKSAKPGVVNFSNFTLDTYRRIVKYKTAFYSFVLPVHMAMLMTGRFTPKDFKDAEAILVPMGEYFQIQDDYLDCYGDPKTIGKIGTDIQDNKCGWLIIQALQRASPAQRKILEENYARDNEASIAKVKEVYKQLNIAKVFHDYEDKAYVDIKQQIDRIQTVPKEVFNSFLGKIFKRQH